MDFLTLLIAVITLGAGVGIGFAIRAKSNQRTADSTLAAAEQKLRDAEHKEKELLATAREKANGIIEEAKRDEAVRRTELSSREQRLSSRESIIDKKIDTLEQREGDLAKKLEETARARSELDEIKKQQLEKLERVASLTPDQAKQILIDRIEQQSKQELLQKMKVVESKSQEEVDLKARTTMAVAMQRLASETTAETSTSLVSIPNDEMKGRIIGKEGRNIKALENETGVEIVVDDTPGAILISAFNPIRRHIAKLAIEKLMKDGRIHPARIEEFVAEAKKEITGQIRKAGEAACFELGIVDFDPKLQALIGRLMFRTSYGQSVLRHSIEMAHIGTIIAEEIGADVNVVKKACLVHDIGKAVDHEIQGTHVEIGINILRKFGVSEQIIQAMWSHHEEYPYMSAEAYIVSAADAISAGRPGARRDSVENYVKRLEELEAVASSFPGIEKVYALQAGREVRVFVKPEEIDDYGAKKLAHDIAMKIEETLKYPGEIRVNVIRELRSVEFAR